MRDQAWATYSAYYDREALERILATEPEPEPEPDESGNETARWWSLN